MTAPGSTKNDDHSAMDARIAEFDNAWRQGRTPHISDFISPQEVDAHIDVLIELIKIDLEYRWRPDVGDKIHGHGDIREPVADRTEQHGLPAGAVLLDNYQRLFPQLGDNHQLPLDLVKK